MTRARHPGTLLALALLLGPYAGAFDDPLPGGASETAIQAAVLLQIVHFVEWKPVPESEFQICVLAGDHWIPTLQAAGRNETWNTLKLRVRRLLRVQEAAGCQVVVAGAPLDERALAALRPLPVLTVGAHDGFARSGGMVELFRAGARVGFELNRAAAERAGLRFSSKMLRLARGGGEPSPAR